MFEKTKNKRKRGWGCPIFIILKNENNVQVIVEESPNTNRKADDRWVTLWVEEGGKMNKKYVPNVQEKTVGERERDKSREDLVVVVRRRRRRGPSQKLNSATF